jgi:hypothetical protein
MAELIYASNTSLDEVPFDDGVVRLRYRVV